MGGCIALVVAAGRGHRVGGPLPKQYRTIAGRPLLARTIDSLAGHPRISGVRVVIHPDDRPLYDEATRGLPLLDPVGGGDSRQESVLRGLESLVELAPDHVLIHDAARPFVPAAVIDRVLAALDQDPGAIPALAVADTLKRAVDGHVDTTVDRAGLWRAQTPQGFRFAAILAAHRAAAGRELTDDAAVAEAAGLAVRLVEGAEEVFKVTTEDDIRRAAERLFRTETRMGTGFDVHRFTDGDHVTLCGVRIAHNQALLGHSDADVALHALTDALLGAVAAGDIGSHFPPSDDRWKAAPSHIFVTHARDQARKRGARIVNADITLICERPKIGPHRSAMIEAVAGLLDVDPDRVSVKATTTEGLGFTGRGEGIAAQAVVCVEFDFTSAP